MESSQLRISHLSLLVIQAWFALCTFFHCSWCSSFDCCITL